MIKFEERDGLYCPVFICAQCGQPIQGPGLVTWDMSDYDNPTFTALHKGACDRAAGRRIPWRELSTFLAQLTYNTQHPFEEQGADASADKANR